MNRFKNIIRPLTWFMALLLTAFVAGCGSDGGGASVVQSSAKAITAYSLAGVIGTINEPAKTIAVTVPFGTNLKALIATYTTTGASLKVGTTVQDNGTTANDYTSPVSYTVFAADRTTATYTVTVAVAIDTSKSISAYSLAGTPGIINEPAKTIAVTVPYGTNIKALAAGFTTLGTSVKVGVVVQSSGITMNDFTGQVTYTVTAADTTTATYTVTVVVTNNFSKAVTAYSFVGYPGVTGTIDETAKTITLTMPSGTDKTALIALFTSTGASVKVGAAAQTSGTTANNFTSAVQYTVTAANGTTAIYTVTVAVAIASAKAITAYSFVGFPSVAGTIDETAKTIALTLPYGTNKTSLVATFQTTGSVVKIGSVVQTSTATANNFTLPKDYIVTAADGTTATYSVTVTVAMNFANVITAYSFVGFPATANAGTIVEATTPKTIAVSLPNGTNVTGLVAIFTTTGADVKVGAAVQTSTATANNFIGAVTYTVTAADGTPATYTVTVSVAAAAGLDLRRTASFAVLSTGSSITATGTTTLTGDAGATSFTGGGTLNFVAGNDYTGGAGQAFLDAVADLPSVISDANSPTLFPCGTSIAPNLSGVALTPGVTCILSDAAILNTGIVTLNGPGVYIIRTAGALTPASSSSVAFSGGASDANTTVFWVVGAADIGSPSTWMGTILTGGAVVLGDTDSLVKGRVLTTAAVTLSNNTITIP